MHCVSYDWVVSSIETGFALPEKDFLIGPVDENDASESVTQSLFNETRFERKRMSKSRRSDPINHLTQEVRRFRGNGSPSDRRSDGSQGLSTLTEGLHVSEVCEEPDDPPVEKESSFTEEYGHLLDDPHDDVFDGLEFSLISCDPEKASFMKKLIQSGSGYLQPRISEDVNYVLVGRDELDDEANDLMEQFKANDSSATFVSYKWLIASAEKNTLLDVEEYQFGDIPDDSTPATPAAEHPNLGFKVTKKDYSQRNAYKSLTSISFSGSISDSIGDQALIDEYSRRSDSTQSKSRAGAADTSSQDEDLTGNSQWKRVGAGLLRDDQSVTEREEWDDACSVISSYASIAADNTKSNVPIVLLASQFASHAEHGQPQAARVQRPQAILNVNNNNALSDMQVRERERRMNSSAASRPGNRAPGRNRRQ